MAEKLGLLTMEEGKPLARRIVTELDKRVARGAVIASGLRRLR